jgi:murein L,D-transpeptidase YcbB/YkuD
LRLPEPLPVYVLYLPNWVDDAGRVHFRDDVYERDRVLMRYYPATAAE